jgi:hypothetical protein
LSDEREDLSDEREEWTQRDEDRRMPGEAGHVRRAYAAPELVEYGTVAKLTQTGSGSIVDFVGMPAMMT